MSIMNHLYDQKAGPSQARPSWTKETSKWRRQTVKAVVVVTALLLGYMVYRSHSGAKSSWSWKLNGQDGDGKEHGSSKGSQYLLGVGKADITGLESNSTSRFTSILIIL
jgi:neutral ceramidase